MCTKERLSSEDDSDGNESAVTEENDSSDVSMSDSDDKSEDEVVEQPTNKEEEEEEEDELIKAIRRECDKQRDHPPPISCDDFITDICFHPQEDYLAVASVAGDVTIYKYTNEENTVALTLELHNKSCRDIEFSSDGQTLYSVSKDKSIMLSEVEGGKLIKFYDAAHEAPINCVTEIDKNFIATGDDDGCVKLWDLRCPQQVYKTKKNEDFISDIISNEARKYLLCSSGDGSLTTIDLQNRKIFMQSEEYEEELTCLGLFRTETKLLAGTSKGQLYLFNWQEFGLHSDAFPGNKTSINDLVPITENIVVTACEDGNLRATHLFPHRHLGIVGQHDLSIEHVDICNDGRFVASSSHNNDVKFWNIKYFEDFEKISNKHKKHEKKKELANNLPSSKVRNASDFFSGLCET